MDFGWYFIKMLWNWIYFLLMFIDKTSIFNTCNLLLTIRSLDMLGKKIILNCIQRGVRRNFTTLLLWRNWIGDILSLIRRITIMLTFYHLIEQFFWLNFMTILLLKLIVLINNIIFIIFNIKRDSLILNTFATFYLFF